MLSVFSFSNFFINLLPIFLHTGKDAGVDDRDGLENRCTRKGTQGSNPCLSAIESDVSARYSFYFPLLQLYYKVCQ